MYTQSPYVVCSHDHDGDVQALLEYSHDLWNFPSLNYKATSRSFDNSVTLEIIFVDTPTFSEYTYKWIEEQLDLSTANHIIVAGHYPSLSPCTYGNIGPLVEYLNPLLQKYQASYFSGHEHCLAHVQEFGVNYFINGIGAYCCYDGRYKNQVTANASESIKYMLVEESGGIEDTSAGFSSVVAYQHYLIVSYFNQDGSLLYETSVIAREIAMDQPADL